MYLLCPQILSLPLQILRKASLFNKTQKQYTHIKNFSSYQWKCGEQGTGTQLNIEEFDKLINLFHKSIKMSSKILMAITALSSISWGRWVSCFERSAALFAKGSSTTFAFERVTWSASWRIFAHILIKKEYLGPLQ